ncbi:MAG: hypothetical protein MUF01_18025, partial [Bryobacterales bacterium]|nr:hypothetical protein [Bryobacterales bacterium]
LFLATLSHPVVDQDVWHEISLAREAFALGHVTTVDSFAYTPTRPVVQHEWGAGVLALLALQWQGAQGLLWLKLALGLALLLLVCAQTTSLARRALLFVPVAFLALNMLQPGFGTVRGQMYSLVAVAALLWFLQLDRQGARWWMAVWLLVFVAWLNVHGGFVLAFGILGAEWLERAFRGERHWRLVGLGSAMLAAVVVNPYGVAYYPYMISALSIRRPDIEEWQPLWVAYSSFPLAVSALVAAALLVAYAVLARGWRQIPGLGILLLLLAASVRTNRIGMFFGLAFVCLAPAALGGTPLARGVAVGARRFSKPLLMLSLMFVLVSGALLWTRLPLRILVPARLYPAYGALHMIYPVGAVDYLRRNEFHGNLMVSFPIGAYVMWTLPKARISIDSRYEVAYAPALVEEAIRLYATGVDANGFLQRFPHDAVLVETFSPFLKTMQSMEGWRPVYSDPQYWVFARPDSPLPPQLDQPQPADGTIP